MLAATCSSWRQRCTYQCHACGWPCRVHSAAHPAASGACFVLNNAFYMHIFDMSHCHNAHCNRYHHYCSTIVALSRDSALSGDYGLSHYFFPSIVTITEIVRLWQDYGMWRSQSVDQLLQLDRQLLRSCCQASLARFLCSASSWMHTWGIVPWQDVDCAYKPTASAAARVRCGACEVLCIWHAHVCVYTVWCVCGHTLRSCSTIAPYGGTRQQVLGQERGARG